MKLIHLSDLHIGKRVNDFSMIDDQKYILEQILNIIDREKPDGVIIAGDVYDKSVPSAEAVEVFDDLLYRLSLRKLQVFIISGNHDSPERIAFASRLIDASGIHLSPVYNADISPFLLKDQDGNEAYIYMLPFIKPINVKKYFPDENIETYTDAMRVAINALKVDESKINILITHQFVTGASRSESEEISVGGTDNVDASVFDNFDYVALGHIHGPQSVSRETIRYCGTPLKYSFSEASHQKSVTVVSIEEDKIQISTVDLKPHHDMVKLKGCYMDVSAKEFYQDLNKEDYYHITLTDEEDIPDVVNKLRVIYPNIMRLEYDNTRTRAVSELDANIVTVEKKPIQLFSEFYQMQNGMEMTEEQVDYCQNIIEKIWEGEDK